MGPTVVMEPTKSVYGLRYISPEVANVGNTATGVITLRPVTNGKKFITKKHRRSIKVKTTETALRELLVKREEEHGVPFPSDMQIFEAVNRLNDYFIKNGVPITKAGMTLRKSSVETSLSNLRDVFSILRTNLITSIALVDGQSDVFKMAAELYAALEDDGWGGFDEALETLTGKQMASMSSLSAWSNGAHLFIGIHGEWSALCEK